MELEFPKLTQVGMQLRSGKLVSMLDQTIEDQSESIYINDNPDKTQKINHLKQYSNQYKHLFITRVQGQKMTQSDALWILNNFAHMRCDSLFYSCTDSEIIKKVSEWCSTGLQTVHK